MGFHVSNTSKVLNSQTFCPLNCDSYQVNGTALMPTTYVTEATRANLK